MNIHNRKSTLVSSALMTLLFLLAPSAANAAEVGWCVGVNDTTIVCIDRADPAR